MGGKMAKKTKPATRERGFSIKPGLGLLLAFALFAAVALYIASIPWIRSLSFPIAMWVVAGVMYFMSSAFSIKNDEKAKRWAIYLAVLGVVLTVFALGVCC
jgi:hypothetical protein